MSTRTSYAPGTPAWVDIGVPDIAAAAAFYGGLFGWELADLGPEGQGYGMFRLNGSDVAGIGPQQMPDAPPFWTVYMAVTDADATTAAVTEHGGTVVVPPMDIPGHGRMAVYQDPSGTFFSAWQEQGHIGCGLVNEPGSFCWNELSAVDVDVARDFYTKVFGWGCIEPAGHPAGTFTVDGEVVCGSHTAGEGEYPAWSVWFSVADTDASTDLAASLGATVLMPPNDMDFGRGSMVAAPDGAVFGLATVKPEEVAD